MQVLTDLYAAKVAGNNLLDDDGGDDLKGGDGMFVEITAAGNLPTDGPAGTILYVYNSTGGPLNMADNNGDHSVGAGDCRIFIKLTTGQIWGSVADTALGA